MFSEDYIMRIIRQATIALARILGLKNTGQYQEATKEIDQTLGILFGLDAEIIRLMDDDSLIILLKKDEVLDYNKLELIAALFKEEGDIHKLQNHNNESIDCYIRSLKYYLMISLETEILYPNELIQKIDELCQIIRSRNLEEKTLWNLIFCYESAGEFAKADTLLLELANRDNATDIVVDEMISFYKRLLDKSPKELSVGRMTREQIRNKLRKLE